MYKINKPISIIAAGLISLYSANAAATYSTHSWSTSDTGSCTSNCSGNGSEYTSTYDTSSVYNKQVKISAWSNTRSYGRSDSRYDDKLEKKEVKYSDRDGDGKKDGYAVDNNESEDDSYTWDGGKAHYERDYVDNETHMDSILFDYGDECVVLDSVIIDRDGYDTDSDIKIMAFTGDKNDLKDSSGNKYGSFDDYLKDKSYDDLMSDTGNWKSYQAKDVKRTGQNYDSDKDGYSDSYKKDFTKYYDSTDGKYKNDYTASSYWLVMADGKADSNDDYFKIKHMGGYDYDSSKGGCQKVEIKCDNPTPPDGQVPVPATGLLLTLGLTLLGYTRRRKAA